MARQVTQFQRGQLARTSGTHAARALLARGAWRVGQVLGKRAASYVTSKAKRSRSDVGDNDIITTQHDTKLRYLKSSYSRKQKSRKRFIKKVRRAVFSDVGLRSWVSDDGGAQKLVSANQQGHDGVLLGGIQQTNNNELLSAFRVAYENATGTINDFKDNKVYVKSMCLDLHITNTGAGTAEIDIYQVRMRKDYASNDRLDTMYTSTFNDAAAPSGFSRTLTTPGVTPFQNSNFCEHFKILSKRTVLLSAGQVTSLQLRTGPRYFDGHALLRNQMGIPGYTKGYLLVYRGVPFFDGVSVVRRNIELCWTQERTMSVARHADGQNEDKVATV